MKKESKKNALKWIEIVAVCKYRLSDALGEKFEKRFCRQSNNITLNEWRENINNIPNRCYSTTDYSTTLYVLYMMVSGRRSILTLKNSFVAKTKRACKPCAIPLMRTYTDNERVHRAHSVARCMVFSLLLALYSFPSFLFAVFQRLVLLACSGTYTPCTYMALIIQTKWLRYSVMLVLS